MVRVCPHCGAASVMGIGHRKRRVILVCPRCDDRFYPNDRYV